MKPREVERYAQRHIIASYVLAVIILAVIAFFVFALTPAGATGAFVGAVPLEISEPHQQQGLTVFMVVLFIALLLKTAEKKMYEKKLQKMNEDATHS